MLDAFTGIDVLEQGEEISEASPHLCAATFHDSVAPCPTGGVCEDLALPPVASLRVQEDQHTFVYIYISSGTYHAYVTSRQIVGTQPPVLCVKEDESSVPSRLVGSRCVK
jgi:hypothetical protein